MCVAIILGDIVMVMQKYGDVPINYTTLDDFMAEWAPIRYLTADESVLIMG